MSVTQIKDACLTAARLFESGDPGGALTALKSVADLTKALPHPHHARLMWLVAQSWCASSTERPPLEAGAEAEAAALAASDPEHAITGWFQLTRLAVESGSPALAKRRAASLLATAQASLGELHPNVYEWQRRLASLMDSSS